MSFLYSGQIKCLRLFLIFSFCLILTSIFVIYTCYADAKEKKIFLGFTMDKESRSVPEGWEYIKYFTTAENQLFLFKEGEHTVFKMKSLNSASAIIKKLDVNLEGYPCLVWSWKINRSIGMAIENRKDRNDCAARVRVIFTNGYEDTINDNPVIEMVTKKLGVKIPVMEPSGFKIDYIWGNYLKKGEVLDYPGSKNHKVVVLEQGNKAAGRWVREKRNVIEDFRSFFGNDPPGLSGIVILTDTDQTNEGVEASYRNILFMNN